MKKIYFLLLCCLIFWSTPSRGQDHFCATDYYMEKLYSANPEARIAQNVADKTWADFVNRPISPEHLVVYENNDTIYEIPVVFHIMHAGQAIGHANNPSNAQINAYLTYLNQTFAATFAHYANTSNGGVKVPIRFVLAKRTPGCNPQATTGINRVNAAATFPNYATYGIALKDTLGVPDADLKRLSNWDRTQYYNIWLVNYIDGPVNSAGGYAQLPPNTNASGDGAVVLSEYTAGLPNSNGNYYNALPHEIGHSFGLYHTFQGISTNATCASNANCTADNDKVCDTEIHPLVQPSCPTNAQINPCTNAPYNNIQYNIMNYAPCYSNKRFTQGQRVRMLFFLHTYRSSLIHSLGAIAPGSGPASPLIAASCTPPLVNNNPDSRAVIGPTGITLGHFSYTTFAYSPGGSAYTDYSCVMTPPTFTVGNSYPIAVKTFDSLNSSYVRVYIDWDNDGTFSVANETALSGYASSGNGWKVSTNITIPNNAVTCTPIRMRVIGDNYTPTPCGTLNHGEAEDYSILLQPAAITAPVLTVTSSEGTSVCTGQSVTFTATANASPANAIIRWYKNNALVGTGTNYTTTSIVNNDSFRARISYPSSCNSNDSSASNILTMYVYANVTPTVAITNSQSNTICAGQSITFTAIATGGGNTPSYQWKVNGINQGTNSATFAPNNLVQGDVVSCVMTSNLSCVSTPTATSNSISVTVNPVVIPSVTINTNNNNLCVSQNLTFTATPVNGGTTPSYQWKVNNVNVSGNGNSYSNNSLNAGDIVSVVMTSNALCRSVNTASSNTIDVISSSNATPTVTITSNKINNTICQNESITFTATPTNGGTAPQYQWKVNGINQGNNSATYAVSNLNNGDVITVVLTSNAACLGTPTATSGAINVIVTTPAVPAVVISTSNNNLCVDSNLTFTAAPTNGGATPAYQWKVNGNNVTGIGATFTASNLNVNDIVSVVMTSNASCITQNTATSNTISVLRNGSLQPSVTIISNKANNAICQGESITFTATPTNGGNAPSYQWRVNGTVIGNTGATYTTTSLSNNDVVTVKLTSTAICLATDTVSSSGITVNVETPAVPSVSIASSNLNLCVNNTLTFTAIPVNGGSTPTYQWKVNGNNVTGTGATFTASNLNSGDVVTVVMTSNRACISTNTATSNSLSVTRIGNLTPTLAITSNRTNNTLCANQNITFTATGTNLGTAPVYVWKINGSPVGTNAATYTAATITNGAVVTCEVVANATCLITSSATSNNITVVVYPLLTPAVSIVASHTNLCINPSVTFTATPVNGGATPTYQWSVNGNNVTGTGATLTIATLQPNDVVRVVMTTSTTCYTSNTATSNNITMTKIGIVAPSVAISNNTVNNTLCQGQTVVFTATPTNGGTTPVYQWRINGNVVGANAATFTTSSLNNNDIVTCSLVSNGECISTAPVNSNTLTMTVNPLLTSTIAITSNANNICQNTSVTFTATTSNAGPNPIYQWKVNGVNVGNNATSYTANNFVNGDVVTCQLTIQDLCVVNNVVNSNNITMQVVTNVTPTATITAANGTAICNYDSVTVTASITNGGSAPTYAWRLNSMTLSQTGSTIALGNLANGDQLEVMVTSNERCVTTAFATSNVLTFNVTTSGPVAITPADINMVCEFNLININAINANGSVAWYINDTLVPNRTGSSIAAFREGTYHAVNTLNGCISVSNTSTIVLDPMPAPVLQFLNGGYQVDDVYDSYKWYFNDAWVANNTSHRHVPHAFGSFKLCVTKDGCNACTEPAAYPDPLGLNKNNAESVKIYPNPTTGKIYVDYPKKLTIEIRAIDGRVMKIEHNTLSIDIADFASGAYMIYLIDPALDHVIQTNKVFKDQ